jgi:hypothetical protein
VNIAGFVPGLNANLKALQDIKYLKEKYILSFLPK